MKILILKGYYLNKCTNWWLAITGIIFFACHLTLRLTFENNWILFSFLLFLGLVIVLYLNRFEAKFIQLSADSIEFTYFNQSYFGKSQVQYAKKDIVAFKKKGIILLSNNGNIVAKARSKALTESDWAILQQYFS